MCEVPGGHQKLNKSVVIVSAVAAAVNIVLEPQWPVGAEGEDPSHPGRSRGDEEHRPGGERGEQDPGARRSEACHSPDRKERRTPSEGEAEADIRGPGWRYKWAWLAGFMHYAATVNNE